MVVVNVLMAALLTMPAVQEMPADYNAVLTSLERTGDVRDGLLTALHNHFFWSSRASSICTFTGWERRRIWRAGSNPLWR